MWRGIVVILFVELIGAPVVAQSRSTESEVDRIFGEWDKPGSPGCALSVMKDGAVIYAAGYGMANLEYEVPITPSSIFHVASVSKQFTAMAVALLVAEGRVAWDDDVRTYVPEVPDFGDRITLRHLVHHTSGLRDQWSLLRMAGWRLQADVVEQEDVLDLVSRQEKLNFIAGSEYLYSNTGFTLLAVVVERVSGLTLREFAGERIFGPLGMTNTHFHDDHQMIVKNRAYAYAPDSRGAFHSSVPDFDVVGATSLFTTVEDMALWDRNFSSGTVGGHEMVEQLHRRGTLNDGAAISYAFGLAHGTHRGFDTVGHGGTDAGYRSHFVRFPDERLSVAVFCNSSSSAPGSLALKVADVYLPRPGSPTDAGAVAVREGSQPTRGQSGTSEALLEQLSRLAGYYRREASDVPTHLVVRQGRLAIQSGPALVALGQNRFQVQGSSTTAEFGPAGADAVTMQLTGATNTVFTRAEPVRPSANDLLDYVGTYYSPELGVQYLISAEESRLKLWNRKLGQVSLIPTYADGFFGAGFYLTFTRSAEHDVDGFTTSTARAWKVRFDLQ